MSEFSADAVRKMMPAKPDYAVEKAEIERLIREAAAADQGEIEVSGFGPASSDRHDALRAWLIGLGFTVRFAGYRDGGDTQIVGWGR